jgi:DNA-binding MarR family transcriptional regulator
MIDRLVRRRLVCRDVHPDDRRATYLDITPTGRAVVASVTARRRAEFGKILRSMDPGMRQYLVQGLKALNEAAGESPEHDWSLGWAHT